MLFVWTSSWCKSWYWGIWTKIKNITSNVNLIVYIAAKNVSNPQTFLGGKLLTIRVKNFFRFYGISFTMVEIYIWLKAMTKTMVLSAIYMSKYASF